MFKNLLITFVLFFSSFITIYPSRKENTKVFDYCYSFENILSRNALNKSKNVTKNYKNFSKDITLLGTQKTKGAFVNMLIDQYKNSKKSSIINYVPNQLYCLTGYWIEKVNPGTFQSLLYKKSKQRIYQYRNIRKEVDAFIKDTFNN